MKKYLILLSLISSNISASLLDDNITHRSSDTIKNSKKSNVNRFFDKHFSGSIGSSFVSSDVGNRHSSFIQGRIDYSTNYADFVLDGQYIDSSIEMTQTNITTGDEREIEYSFSGPELLESYVDLKPLDNLTLSVGLKKIVWGQFEPFSPIDFALPLYFSRNYVDYTKTKARVPKQNVSLTFFPHPKFEISGYFFPEYEVDPIIEEINEDDNIAMPDGSDLYQTAARVMFYPEFATFGFTYYNGFTNIDNSQGNTYNSVSSSVDENPFLVENEMFGFEFAKQFESFSFKFEYTVSDYVQDLTTTTSNTNYLNWVQNNNNNKFYVDGDLHFGAAGVEFSSGLWNYDLMVYYYEIKYDDNDQTGVNYDEDITGDDDEGPTGIGNFLPSVSFSRYLSDEKNTQIGLATGVLGVGQGAALYASGNINESIDWLVATEYLEYFSNMVIDDANDDDGYESDDDFTLGFRASIQYKF